MSLHPLATVRASWPDGLAAAAVLRRPLDSGELGDRRGGQARRPTDHPPIRCRSTPEPGSRKASVKPLYMYCQTADQRRATRRHQGVPVVLLRTVSLVLVLPLCAPIWLPYGRRKASTAISSPGGLFPMSCPMTFVKTQSTGAAATASRKRSRPTSSNMPRRSTKPSV